MDITFTGGKINGSVTVPPSKSYTHRAIIMAALSEGRCIVRNPLESLDTKATIEAVKSMGVSVERTDDGLIIDTKEIHAPEGKIDVLNSGTTMRLMTGLSSLFDTPVTLDGDDSIRRRPMRPLLDALGSCGVDCRSNNGLAPVTVCGPIKKDSIEIDGSMSSQFVSSLLMMSPLVGRPMDVRIKGKLVSKPYVRITTSMMGRFGVHVDETNDGYHIEPQRYRCSDYQVPSDFSSAAFPLVAGGLAGKVSISGLDMDDPQGDKRIVEILESAGCRILVDGDIVTCSNSGRLDCIDVNMSNIPDLFPIVAVLLSTAKGTSTLYGAPQLKFKESDRIASVVMMLRALGADVKDTDDGCIINGVERLKGGRVDHRGDHRLMMSGAIASLISDGPISMVDDSCWEVSYPGFVEQMRSLGLRC